MLKALDFPRTPFAFITELIAVKNTVVGRVIPQVVLAAIMGMIAQAAKLYICGFDVEKEEDCPVTLKSTAHAIAGSVLGFLLVFCNNLNYKKYYDGKVAFGNIYDSLRNINVAAAAFMREPLPGEPGHVANPEKDLVGPLREACSELRRLTNIMFAFMRQSVREQRHGYPDQAQVMDDELLKTDACGNPSLGVLLTESDRNYYSAIDFNNRANIVAAQIQRLVERQRRLGFIYEKSAFDIYKETEIALESFKTCEKIVTTPVPYQYLHMLNFVLFCYVFSAPFVFSASFKWITFFPSAVLALGFYGIAEIGRIIADPFNWTEPRHDLTGIGRRIASETLRIWDDRRVAMAKFSMDVHVSDLDITTIDRQQPRERGAQRGCPGRGELYVYHGAVPGEVHG